MSTSAAQTRSVNSAMAKAAGSPALFEPRSGARTCEVRGRFGLYVPLPDRATRRLQLEQGNQWSSWFGKLRRYRRQVQISLGRHKLECLAALLIEREQASRSPPADAVATPTPVALSGCRWSVWKSRMVQRRDRMTLRTYFEDGMQILKRSDRL